MNILLACNAGVSTAILASKMENYAKENNIDAKVWAVDFSEVDQEIRNNHVDCVLIGPQISYKLGTIKKDLDPLNIPIAVMGFSDYGTQNVTNILKTAESLIKGE